MNNVQTPPLVTVCIATFNGEATIFDTLHSIELQTYENLEVIIRDDGSTDKTLEICRAFTFRNRGWKLCETGEQKGMLENYQELLKLANGEYCCLVDQDDLRHPAFVKQSINSVQQNRGAIGALSKVGVLWQENPRLELELVHINSMPEHLSSVKTSTRVRTLLLEYSDIWMYGMYGTSLLKYAFEAAPASPIFPAIVVTRLFLAGPPSNVDEVLIYYRAKGREKRGSLDLESRRVSVIERRTTRIPQVFLQAKAQLQIFVSQGHLRQTERISILFSLTQSLAISVLIKSAYRLAEKVRSEKFWDFVNFFAVRLRPYKYIEFLMVDPVGRGYLDRKWRSF